ncbi:hypothetical protein [Pantanalinema sp. GBBB05]|uniref:hypothetical protein n=1 Tax=Pantanalinema sp. GBBB05 TaxID=2604139 RepID=UPI001DA7788E|nr:hypothetical protein [Pantanalinema sp. GBBB05]
MKLELSIIAKLEWNSLIPEDPYESYAPKYRTIGPPSIEKVGPFLERPALVTFTSPGGLVSLVIRRVEVMPLVILFGQQPKVIPLPYSPRAVSARSDGAWVLEGTTLTHYDVSGNIVKSIAIDVLGAQLIGVTDNSVWVVSRGQAQFIDAEGHARTPYQWKNSPRSPVNLMQDSICWLTYELERICCLDPNGSEQVIPPPVPQRVGGILSAIVKNNLITTGLFNRYFYYRSDGKTFQLNVITAGLTTSGEPFISFTKKDGRQSWIYLLTNGTIRQFPDVLQIVGVDQDRTLAYSRDRAIWYKGTELESSFIVGSSNFREQIFPYIWNSWGAWGLFFEPTITSDGTIILSTTGSSGLAVIGLCWTP